MIIYGSFKAETQDKLVFCHVRMLKDGEFKESPTNSFFKLSNLQNYNKFKRRTRTLVPGKFYLFNVNDNVVTHIIFDSLLIDVDRNGELRCNYKFDENGKLPFKGQSFQNLVSYNRTKYFDFVRWFTRHKHIQSNSLDRLLLCDLNIKYRMNATVYQSHRNNTVFDIERFKRLLESINDELADENIKNNIPVNKKNKKEVMVKDIEFEVMGTYTLPVEEAASNLGVTVGDYKKVKTQVGRKYPFIKTCHKLDTSGMRYTKDEEKFIKKYMDDVRTIDIANVMNRTRKAIQIKKGNIRNRTNTSEPINVKPQIKQKSSKNDLGARLKQYRLENKISQDAIGKQLGIIQPDISSIERGKLSVSDEMYKKIDAFITKGVTPKKDNKPVEKITILVKDEEKVNDTVTIPVAEYVALKVNQATAEMKAKMETKPKGFFAKLRYAFSKDVY